MSNAPLHVVCPASTAQRLKAERELEVDLKEAEATESSEKKSKLVSEDMRPTSHHIHVHTVIRYIQYMYVVSH